MENYVTFSTNYKSSLQEVQLQAERHPNFAAFLEVLFFPYPLVYLHLINCRERNHKKRIQTI